MQHSIELTEEVAARLAAYDVAGAAELICTDRIAAAQGAWSIVHREGTAVTAGERLACEQLGSLDATAS
eukprot:gene41263-13143_t